jgi:hypothetical protein
MKVTLLVAGLISIIVGLFLLPFLISFIPPSWLQGTTPQQLEPGRICFIVVGGICLVVAFIMHVVKPKVD